MIDCTIHHLYECTLDVDIEQHVVELFRRRCPTQYVAVTARMTLGHPRIDCRQDGQPLDVEWLALALDDEFGDDYQEALDAY